MTYIQPWIAADLDAHPHRWQLALSEEQTEALRLGGEHSAPVHHAIVRSTLRSVFSGWGFLVVHGVVRPGCDPTEAETILRAMAPCLGCAHPQSLDKSMVGWLEDHPGSDWRLEQPMHTDGGDLLVLLCIRPAAVGGHSRLVSAMSAYEKLRTTAPELLAELCRPWKFDRKGRPGPPTLEKTIFEQVDGELHCFHLPGTVRSTPAIHGLTPHTPTEKAALDALDAAVNDPALRYETCLQPGDLLILDNSAALHARSGYEDSCEAEKRLLLRMWWTVDRQAWRRLAASTTACEPRDVGP